MSTATPTVSQRLAAAGITLPPVSGPFGAYVPARRCGDLIYVAGQLPMKDGQLMATGPVPSKCPVDQAKAAARQCVINGLAAVNSLAPAAVDALTGVVRVGAFVSSDANFTAQPQIVDAASELLLEIFGKPAGQHARVSVGVNTLPRDGSVEIEFLFQTGG